MSLNVGLNLEQCWNTSGNHRMERESSPRNVVCCYADARRADVAVNFWSWKQLCNHHIMCPSVSYDKACNHSPRNAALWFSFAVGGINKRNWVKEKPILIKYRLMVGFHWMCKWNRCYFHWKGERIAELRTGETHTAQGCLRPVGRYQTAMTDAFYIYTKNFRGAEDT